MFISFQRLFPTTETQTGFNMQVVERPSRGLQLGLAPGFDKHQGYYSLLAPAKTTPLMLHLYFKFPTERQVDFKGTSVTN